MARTSRSNAGLLIPLLLVVAVVSACNETSKSATIASNAPANVVVTDPPSTPAAPVHTTQALPPTKHRTTATKTGASVLAAGVVLPNRALTPGATNPAVTQSNIDRTICLTGYTKTMREVAVLLHLGVLLITNDGGTGHFASLTPISSIPFLPGTLMSYE